MDLLPRQLALHVFYQAAKKLLGVLLPVDQEHFTLDTVDSRPRCEPEH